MLFCCLFGTSARFSEGTSESLAVSIRLDSVSGPFLCVSSDSIGSVIGHTNPVRGV
jgi:hypothetical protein